MTLLGFRSHVSHAEPQFTPVYRSRHPRTPQRAIKPFAAENSPDHLNYYLRRPCRLRFQTTALSVHAVVK